MGPVTSNYETTVGPVGGLRARIYEYIRRADHKLTRREIADTLKESYVEVCRAVKQLDKRRLLGNDLGSRIDPRKVRHIAMDADLSHPPLYNREYIRFVGEPTWLPSKIYERIRREGNKPTSVEELAFFLQVKKNAVYNAIAKLRVRGSLEVAGMRNGLQYFKIKVMIPLLRDSDD